jgi:conjugative relaxase-like TrwC/TraI family protein
MLSIGKIAQGQHKYYERQVARGEDDYYSGRGEAAGEWTGNGAKALGLAGRITPEQFNALIAGNDPRDPATRLRSSEQDPKVAAFDLTFSAPKSVSVLFAVAPAHISGQLVACHEEAVGAALDYLQGTAVSVRRGRAGEHVERAGGLIAATYRHRMSRALDPQLHTHIVAANLAQGPDGRFTALHSSQLYREAKTAGYLYQAHLRALVSERLGLEWGPTRNGAAELAGVARSVIEFFSKRREEMLRAAAEGGISLDSKSAAEHAALATRERKKYGVETHTWREEVQACAAEQGLGSDEVTRLLHTGHERASDPTDSRPTVDEQTLGDHLAGPGGLTERSNTFDVRAVLQEFAAAARAGALLGEVREMASRFTARNDVLATTRGEMTTAELTDIERRLIAAATSRASEQCCVVGERLTERSIAAADRELTTEQAKAVRAVTGSGHGVSVIEALAGTGKTYTAGVLREVYEAAGIQVLGVAPTGRAARELTEEAGIPAPTLDRLLTELEKFDQTLPRGCVVVLDEAGMAATRASAKLLHAAEQTGAKVIAIGDPGQLASVQAGGWLGAIGRQLGAVRLTEVMRQRDPAERRALAALHDRQPAPYLQWADQAGRIETFEEPDAAREQALAEWTTAAAEVGPAQAVMIARNNELRDQLNSAARELRKEQGALGEERDYGGIQLAVGDRIICRRNDRTVDVDNGMRGTVRHLDANTVTIDTDGGLTRELPAAYVQEHVEHAYSLTGHGMQGGTVQTAIVIASPRELSSGWSYTALSRARGQTRLLLYEESLERERSEFAPPDQTEKATRTELLTRTEQRMSERDDEDLAIEQLPQREHDPKPSSDHTTRPPGERIAQLRAQLDALPTRALRRIEDLSARLSTLTAQREQLEERLAILPAPTRRLGREHDPSAVERAHLQSALQANDREMTNTLTDRTRHERDLGANPAEARTERDDLQRELTKLTREYRTQEALTRSERSHDRTQDPKRDTALDLGL